MLAKKYAIKFEIYGLKWFQKLTTINLISIYRQLSKESGSVILPSSPLGTPLFLVDWLIMTLNDNCYKEIKNSCFV